MANLRFDLLRDDATRLTYTDEASLRGGFAAMAYLHGWSVRQEVVIPKWGRLDLVIDHPKSGWAVPIEFKLLMTRQGQVRKAFQQADGYARWLRENDTSVLVGRFSKVLLCVPNEAALDWDIVVSVGMLYTDTVKIITGPALVDKLRLYGDADWSGRAGPEPVRERLAAIDGHLKWHSQQLALLRAARATVAEVAEDAERLQVDVTEPASEDA